MVRKLIDRADLLIACDGALTVCEEHGIQVDVLVGDMDSVEQHHLDAYLERGGTLIERPNQHANDLTKALVYLEEQGVESCTVLGATGGDRQHEWANLLSCAASSLEITCVRTAYRYEFLKTNKKYAIELVPGEVFPFRTPRLLSTFNWREPPSLSTVRRWKWALKDCTTSPFKTPLKSRLTRVA